VTVIGRAAATAVVQVVEMVPAGAARARAPVGAAVVAVAGAAAGAEPEAEAVVAGPEVEAVEEAGVPRVWDPASLGPLERHVRHK
jgi:hypothetical protein